MGELGLNLPGAPIDADQSLIEQVGEVRIGARPAAAFTSGKGNLLGEPVELGVQQDRLERLETGDACGSGCHLGKGALLSLFSPVPTDQSSGPVQASRPQG